MSGSGAPIPRLALAGGLALSVAAPGRSEGASLHVHLVDVSEYPATSAYVSVLDDAGESITGLKANDFELLLDGAPITVPLESTSVFDLDEGIAVVLAIDRSGSMKGPAIEAARAAATEFVSRIAAADHVALVAFDHEVDVIMEFSSNQQALTEAIASVDIGGDTALYDAVGRSLELLAAAPFERRALIALTDGKDTKSGTAREDCLGAVKGANAVLFTVGFGDQADAPTLKALAGAGSGSYYEAVDAASLVETYQLIAGNLQNQYRLRFRQHYDRTQALHQLECRAHLAAGTVGESTPFQSPYDLTMVPEPTPNPEAEPPVDTTARPPHPGPDLRRVALYRAGLAALAGLLPGLALGLMLRRGRTVSGFQIAALAVVCGLICGLVVAAWTLMRGTLP